MIHSGIRVWIRGSHTCRRNNPGSKIVFELVPHVVYWNEAHIFHRRMSRALTRFLDPLFKVPPVERHRARRQMSLQRSLASVTPHSLWFFYFFGSQWDSSTSVISHKCPPRAQHSFWPPRSTTNNNSLAGSRFPVISGSILRWLFLSKYISVKHPPDLKTWHILSPMLIPVKDI